MTHNRLSAVQSQAQARTVSDSRPVRIERSSKGVLFFDNATGNQLHRLDAIAIMRSYKAAQEPKARKAVGKVYGSGRSLASYEAEVAGLYAETVTKPKARHRVSRTVWTIELWRTVLASGKQTLLVSDKAETFAALGLKLASLCMSNPSASDYAVEVVLTQSEV